MQKPGPMDPWSVGPFPSQFLDYFLGGIMFVSGGRRDSFRRG